MRVLFASSEIYPYVKTGGLGDVAGALPQALLRQGIDVRLLLPGYPEIMSKLSDRRVIGKLAELEEYDAQIIMGKLDNGLISYVIDAPHFYNRASPYGYEGGKDWPDNYLRFAAMGFAARDIVQKHKSWVPDIVHGHDWQCGMIPVYLKEFIKRSCPKTIMTFHNMAYQGLFPYAALPALKIPATLFSPEGIEFYGQIGFLKAGLQYADALTTVSPTYALEIQEPDMGCGLDGLLRHRHRDLTGILNGVDTAIWNPEQDPFLVKNYSVESPGGKQENKRALLEELDLQLVPKKPVFVVISRLVPQKGLDLLPQAARVVLERGAGLVILGTGDAALEEELRNLELRWPGQVSVRLEYNEALAHRIIAGADCVIIPSRFEPCGLVQMYGLRYGTIPLVRRTGGLVDSVVGEGKKMDGFIFDDADPLDLALCLLKAYEAYKKPAQWSAMQKRGMAKDVSWDASAMHYKQLYNRLAGR